LGLSHQTHSLLSNNPLSLQLGLVVNSTQLAACFPLPMLSAMPMFASHTHVTTYAEFFGKCKLYTTSQNFPGMDVGLERGLEDLENV